VSEAGSTRPAERPRGAGPRLLLELRRGAGPLRAQLEAGLRAAIRDGRLAVGARLPSSRTLARDLGVSRRLVVEAYEQLVAEGFLAARHGSGTVVAEAAAAVPAGPARPSRRALAYDFFPGVGDLAGFPRAEWLRAARAVLHDVPDAALGYPDARGVPALRTALAAHLARTRGVVADPGRIVVCAGVTQALALLGRVLRAAGHEAVAVEDPSLPPHRAVLAAAGLEVVPVPVDDEGLRVDALPATGVGAVVVTPAHHFPLGMVLAPARRAALTAWARERDGLVVEDDYDAEFRFDRQPVGALQALAPAQVAYAGSASKALAPGLRLGWLVLPAGLARAVAEAKALEDGGCAVLDQLVLGRLLSTAAYDRHLRLTRRRLAGRRAAVVAAVAEHLPAARVEGIAAGLHAVVRLPAALDADALLAAASRRDVGAWPLVASPGERTDVLLLGYGNLPEPALSEGVRRLADAVAEAG
jgi:GntR family transcriptional regulator/MocR family aminotransferase